MQSLRDKLLKAGLVTQEQAEAATRKAPRPAPPPRAAAPPQESERDRERRLNREMAEKQKQIRALCDGSEVADRGESPFFFRTRRRELRRMYVKPEQLAALEKGDLAVVDRPNGQDRPHALVPRAVADQILALEPKAIRFWARAPGESYGFEDAADPVEQAAAPPEGEAPEGSGG